MIIFNRFYAYNLVARGFVNNSSERPTESTEYDDENRTPAAIAQCGILYASWTIFLNMYFQKSSFHNTTCV